MKRETKKCHMYLEQLSIRIINILDYLKNSLLFKTILNNLKKFFGS
jgi:hypothetical protein